MHGSPLLRTAGVLLLLLLAGVPLYRMTHEAAAAIVAPAASAPAENSQVRLEVAFAQKPVHFQISYLGKPIWESDNVTGLTAEKGIAMNYPKEGVDLEFNVTWPAGTPLCAARLSVAANEAEPVEKTLWGTGQIDDVLTFP